MHELSIVTDLVALCEENLKKQHKSKVVSLTLKIGRLSGVEIHYLQSCFDVFKLGSVCEDAKLIINEQNIVVKCSDCGTQSELSKNEFICPKCGSDKLEVIDGEDMYLMRLEME